MSAVAPPPPPPKKKLVRRPPARKQVDVGQVEKKQPEQSGSVLNIWYNKWAGGDKYDSYNAKEKSQTRVNIKTDAGFTRADKGGNAYLCLFFARGCCPYGHDCPFLHRLPSPSLTFPNTSLDVFGREKHSDYRDDMGGVGSFSRINRTLYVGRITETRDTAEMVERHFEEFGEIERIKILQSRGVAFVTYVSEWNAQFAKEAMMHQSLDEGEVLNVRWATEDPNPTAARAEHKRLIQTGQQGIAKALDPEFVQAVREMDQFEGLLVEGEGQGQGQGEGEKRGLEDGEGEEERGGKKARIDPPPPPEPTKAAAGILSANAIDSLKFLASLQQQSSGGGAGGGGAGRGGKAAAGGAGGLGGLLAQYGSDSEEEE